MGGWTFDPAHPEKHRKLSFQPVRHALYGAVPQLNSALDDPDKHDDNSNHSPILGPRRPKAPSGGVLIDKGDRLVFVKDIEFASPSAAAAVIHGGHANGLTAWKDSHGTTLKELEVV